MNTSRRNFLASTTALVASGFLAAGCAVQTVNGVTSITINTAAVNTDGSAVITAAQSVLAIPAVATLLGSSDSIANTTLGVMKTTIAAIAAATSGSATASINTANVQSLIASLITDEQQFATTVNGVVGKLAAADAAAVASYLAAISGLLSFIQIAASMAPTSATRTALTEAEALHIATH